jgi:hypothetical protein
MPMLEHVGSDDELDLDLSYTRLQNDIIQESEGTLYNRTDHNVQSDEDAYGNDPIKNSHSLHATSVSSHADRGFDYRDFPDNVKQDHEGFDPYIQYLHENGLIGKNKIRYITNYLNIDSRNRNVLPCTRNSNPITLKNDPFLFNSNRLMIEVTGLGQSIIDRFIPGSKFIIRNLQEKMITLRSSVLDNFGNSVESFVFTEGSQIMCTNTNPNLITAGQIEKDLYTDIKVRYEGFQGDIRTKATFNFSDFTVTQTDNGDGTITFHIEEDVYGDIPLDIADFTIDEFGIVIADNTQRPYTDVISWTPVATSLPISLPPGYFTAVENELTQSVPAPSIPTTFLDYIRYIEEVQNVTRPILENFVGVDGFAFVENYQANNDTFSNQVQFVLDNLISTEQTSRVGNIPINFLNKTHIIYLTETDAQANLDGDVLTNDIPNETDFYIQLDRPYQQNVANIVQPFSSNVFEVTTYTRPVSDISINFKHYGGIPNRNINAEYPLGPLADAGYRIVDNVLNLGDRVFVTIELNRQGLLNTEFGGECIELAFVEEEDPGFPQPNEYTVNLDLLYYRVAMIKMVNSQFPITQKAFNDGLTGAQCNNRFYWQNLEDGDITYVVEVETGDYTAESFVAELESKVNAVERFDQDISRGINNFMRFSIDDNIDLFTAEAFTSYVSVSEPFVSQVEFTDINTTGSPENLDPENAYYIYPNGYFIDFPDTDPSCRCIRVKINHNNHGLERFDTINITNAINYGNISADILNGTHTITNVVDDNNYDIVLHNVNDIVPDDPSNAGGYNVNILIPIKFRLRFDFDDTVGDNLGFRSVGFATSITEYDTIITNNVLYEDEDILNVIRLDKGVDPSTLDLSTVSIRNAITLIGPSYLLIECQELNNISNKGKIKNIFYKINLQDNRTSNEITRDPMAYDTYSNNAIYFTEPLKLLSKLTFKFYTPDGDLYDFNGKDHSFMLEIITYEEIPEGTSLQVN